MSGLKKYSELLRLSHWVKNLFVLAPLFFSGQFAEPGKFKAGLLAFLAMGFGASAIYILNDLADRNQDRLHPIKQHRPLAGRTVPESFAKLVMPALAGLGLALAFYLNQTAGLLLLAYLAINLLYTFWLKHFPVIDISVIGLGFLIRVLLGGAATQIPVSHWLVMMTFVLALFLALGKRHDDLLLIEKTGTPLRRSLQGYNLKFTSQAMTMLAGTLFLLYFQYLEIAPTASRFQGKFPYVSGIIVLLGMLRYLQATFVYEKSGSPITQLFTDRFLQVIVLAWLGHFTYMLYV